MVLQENTKRCNTMIAHVGLRWFAWLLATRPSVRFASSSSEESGHCYARKKGRLPSTRQVGFLAFILARISTRKTPQKNQRNHYSGPPDRLHMLTSKNMMQPTTTGL